MYCFVMKGWKITLALLVLAAPLVVYVVHFGNLSISDNPADWGSFGDYIGGIYAALVTFLAIYLTRHLEKRDAERNKAKSAVGEIYEQIGKIDYQHVNMNSANRLLRLIKEYELYIPTALFERLTDLYDDYVVAKDNPKSFNLQKEEGIKKQLKKLYDA